jgi:hypothetical protein
MAHVHSFDAALEVTLKDAAMFDVLDTRLEVSSPEDKSALSGAAQAVSATPLACMLTGRRMEHPHDA